MKLEQLRQLHSVWGKKNRLAQLFKPSKDGEYRTVMFAIDHDYFLGAIKGLENPTETIVPLVKYADAISPTKGTLENYLDPLDTTPAIIRISGGNSIDRGVLSDESIITPVKDVLDSNAIGVSVSVYVGQKYEAQTTQNLGTAVKDAKEYGLLVLGITAVGKELKEKKKDPRYLALAGRIIQSFKADILKTYYCDGFEKVRKDVKIPIVIAGGTRAEDNPEKVALEYTYNAIQAGADGIDMGRNIFQSDKPLAMLQAVRKIVHDGSTAKEALEFYNDFKAP